MSTPGKFSFSMIDPYELLFVRLPKLYRRQDGILHIILGIVLLVGVVFKAIDLLTYHYAGLFIPAKFITAVPGVILLWIVGVFLSKGRWLRTGLLVSGVAQSYLYILVMGSVIASMVTTPFPIVDRGLLHFDQFFHFSTLAIVGWTFAHPWLKEGLTFCYNTWFFLVVLMPLVLAVLKDRDGIDVYMIATFITFLVGVIIYYFWPTIAPAGILHSAYFTEDQHELVTRFQEIHHHLPITVFNGGVIAFPSFHVINNLLILYVSRRYRWLFLPLLVVCSFSILATMMLGYHYLADVLAGFLIAYLSIKLTQLLLRRFSVAYQS